MLPSRPIHTSVDRAGEYLLTAYNGPSNVTVHRIKSDGTLGDAVSQPGKPDAGIYGHQIRTTPGNQTAIFVARGNNAAGGKPEDPGALKVYRLQGRRADQHGLDRARHRLGLRAAASRFPPDSAVGLRLDRAAEQALCLQAAAGRRARPRSDVHQGDPGRSRQRQAVTGRRADPRASERPLRLPHQPQRRPRSTSTARRSPTAARATSRCSRSIRRPASRR